MQHTPSPESAAGAEPRPPIRLPPIRISDLEVDVLQRTARLGDEAFPLTGPLLSLLCLLAANAGRVLTRAEIGDALWRDRPHSDNAVDRLVADLRRRLRDDAAHPRFVGTVIGRGYRFIVTGD